MAYDRDKIYKQAQELIKKKNLIFVEDIIALLPISKQTFYDYFPTDSDKLDNIKQMLELNKVGMKVSMRSKWYKSDAPALQISLMKLICTEEERKKLLTGNINEDQNKDNSNSTVVELPSNGR